MDANSHRMFATKKILRESKLLGPVLSALWFLEGFSKGNDDVDNHILTIRI